MSQTHLATFKRTTLPAIAIISALLLTVLIYWPGLSGPFLLDDQPNLEPSRVSALTLAELSKAMLSNASGQLGRPISVLSFIFTEHFHGYAPWAYKYQNLMIHLVIGLLLFWLGGRLLIALKTLKSQHAWLAAGITAFIWLVHPLHVSTTLYAVQRMAQLSTLFTLMALLFYVISRPKLDSKPMLGLLLMTGGLTMFGLLAIFSKENGALIPLYILTIELFIFRFKTTAQSRRPLWFFQSIFIIGPLVIAALYVATHIDHLSGGYALREFSLVERVLTQVHVIWMYIGMTITPQLSEMSLFHDDFPITHNLDIATATGIVGVGLLLTTAAVAYKRAPLVGFGIIWFFISHALESTIIALELVFEHRNYLASFGLLLPIVYYVFQAKNKVPPLLIYAFFIGVIVFNSTLTNIRANTWANEELLHTVTLEYHPNSTRTLSGLANIYAIRGDLAKSQELLQQASELDPNNAGTLLHALTISCFEKTERPDLILRATKLLKTGIINAYVAQSIHNLTFIYYSGKCQTLNPDALLQLTTSALANNPITDRFVYYIGIKHGRLLMHLERFEEAAEYLDGIAQYADFAPPAFQHDSLYSQAYAEIIIGELNKATQTIAKLKQLNTNPLIEITADINKLELLADKLRNAHTMQTQNNMSKTNNVTLPKDFNK